MLHVIDDQWKDHLLSMDHLKEGIGLRGYGQKDPLVEYKKESFALFQDMMDRIEDETVRYLFFLQVTTSGPGSGPGGSDGNGGGYPIGAGRLVRCSRSLPKARMRKKSPMTMTKRSSPLRMTSAAPLVEDFTRNIQRKKDKEMAELQFAGGSSGQSRKQAVSEKKRRPQ